MFKFLRSQYVGRVKASSLRVTYDSDGDEISNAIITGHWILTKSPIFGRRAKLVGNPGQSPEAMEAYASVLAWKKGGPLPAGIDRSRNDHARGDVIDLTEWKRGE